MREAALTFGLALGLAFLLVKCMTEVDLATMETGLTQGTAFARHEVLFERDGVRLRVPRNYLRYWDSSPAGQSQPSLHATATFPGFAGATRETRRCFDGMGHFESHGCDVVAFTAERPAGPALAPGRPYWFSSDPESQPVPAEHGLSRDPKLPNNYVWIGRDSHDTISVNCPAQLEACSLRMIASGLVWRVQFPKRLLPEWRRIVDGLRTLIAGFEARAAAATTVP